jgi:glycine dehydrogenase subunit 1
MRYLPQSGKEVAEMLKEIGVKDIEELFSSIPREICLKGKTGLKKALSEQELLDVFYKRALKNKSLLCVPSFLGAGAYNHYVPVAVDHILLRSEFYTAYTPYQPEMAQGTLQAIFEFQTMMAELTGMDAANASLYDGASAAPEAVLMAHRIKKGKKVLVAKSLNPFYRETLKTYTKYLEFDLVEIGFGKDGRLDLDEMKKHIDADTCAVVAGQPNFFGVVEDISAIHKALPAENRPLLITMVSEALSLAILEPPGKIGADIVAGEARSFGIPIGLGGPALGFITSKKEFARQIPGRIVGQTTDKEGRRGFVLTLTTREQHIRREKATSNICSNEGLCMLAATVYLSLMGRVGLKKLADQNLAKCEYLKKVLKEAGFKLVFDSPSFNEILIQLPCDAKKADEKCFDEGMEGGLSIRKFYEGIENGYLLAVTELTRKEDIDKFVKLLGGLK